MSTPRSVCLLLLLNEFLVVTLLVDQRIDKAKKLAPGKVDVAISFVCYEHELEPAVNFVFGQTLICKGAQCLFVCLFFPSHTSTE